MPSSSLVKISVKMNKILRRYIEYITDTHQDGNMSVTTLV